MDSNFGYVQEQDQLTVENVNGAALEQQNHETAQVADSANHFAYQNAAANWSTTCYPPAHPTIVSAEPSWGIASTPQQLQEYLPLREDPVVCYVREVVYLTRLTNGGTLRTRTISRRYQPYGIANDYGNNIQSGYRTPTRYYPVRRVIPRDDTHSQSGNWGYQTGWSSSTHPGSPWFSGNGFDYQNIVNPGPVNGGNTNDVLANSVPANYGPISRRPCNPGLANYGPANHDPFNSRPANFGPANPGPIVYSHANSIPIICGHANSGPDNYGPLNSRLANFGPANAGPPVYSLANPGPTSDSLADPGPANLGPPNLGPPGNSHANLGPTSHSLANLGPPGNSHANLGPTSHSLANSGPCQSHAGH